MKNLDGVNPYDPNDSFRSEDSLAVNLCGSQVFTENGRKLQTLSSNQRFSGEKRS